MLIVQTWKRLLGTMGDTSPKFKNTFCYIVSAWPHFNTEVLCLRPIYHYGLKSGACCGSTLRGLLSGKNSITLFLFPSKRWWFAPSLAMNSYFMIWCNHCGLLWDPARCRKYSHVMSDVFKSNFPRISTKATINCGCGVEPLLSLFCNGQLQADSQHNVLSW